MGDVIHTLPALSDAMAAIPDIKFTWLVEEGFHEIASWHPAVEQVISVALRKQDRSIKKNLACVKKLREKHFDLIIDAQGLLKSAIFTRLARGKARAGYDKQSCRESIASYFYQNKFKVNRDLHAIDRTRILFATALGYKVPITPAIFNINLQLESQANNIPYLVFLHGTTWESKHWPEQYWRELANIVAEFGFNVQVTWATPEQKARAQRLAAYAPNVTMLDHLSINQAAQVLNNAHGVVAVDTGFAHLAGALRKPIVAVYGPTDIKKCGVVGEKSVNLASQFACAPCQRRVCNYTGPKPADPPCFQGLSPTKVWEQLKILLN